MGAEEDYDVHRLFERLRREQLNFADRLVQPPARGVPSKPASALREELASLWWESSLNINRADYLWVVAVAHGSRKPGYWKQRFV